MKLEVTQEHIDKGIKMRVSKCPIALALYDVGFKTASVFMNIVVSNGEEQVVKSPLDLFQFAQAFDRGDHCVPTVFDIPNLRAADAPEGATLHEEENDG